MHQNKQNKGGAWKFSTKFHHLILNTNYVRVKHGTEESNPLLRPKTATQNCEQPFFCTWINLYNEFLNQRMTSFTWWIPCCESSAESSTYFVMYGMLLFKHCLCVCFWFVKCWQACAKIPITSLSSRNLKMLGKPNWLTKNKHIFWLIICHIFIDICIEDPQLYYIKLYIGLDIIFIEKNMFSIDSREKLSSPIWKIKEKTNCLFLKKP